MKLAELQQTFIDYLIKGDEQFSQYVSDQGPVTVETRLNIYSNAYRQRLREAIDSDHPMLGIYLGDTLFEQMVEGYITQHPSSTHSLRYFADQLPEFLQTATLFCEHPQLAELAHFERKLLDVFDAPSANAISLEQLHARSPDSWPEMTLRFHPSVQVFECHWNTVEIWQALKQEQAPPDITQTSCSWLLWRNQSRLSEFTSLRSGQRAFLDVALKGKNFAEMCEALLQFVSEQEASHLALQTLTQWIDAGVVTQLN